jgi:hypothetical protein
MTYLSNMKTRFAWSAFGGGPRHLQSAGLYAYFNISASPISVQSRASLCMSSFHF